jgi:HlyD family secretion protein
MKEKRPEIIFSDPVKEIMGNPPGKIIRWGTAVLFSVFSLFILFSWFIRYPDTIPATVEITTRNPPVTMVAKITGRIKRLNVHDKDSVSPGDILAVLETAASIDEIKILSRLTDTLNNPGDVNPEKLPVLTELGELQGTYSTFLKNLTDYHNLIVNDFYGNKINSIQQEITGIQDYIRLLRETEKVYAEKRGLEANQFRRDSLLFIAGLFSESDFEKSRQKLLDVTIALLEIRGLITNKTTELDQKKQTRIDYSIQRTQENEKYFSTMNESLQNLKAQLKIWEVDRLMKSTVEGKVTFTKYWSENQTVIKDEPVLYIVPHNAGEFIGRINLKMLRSGKVREGQIVNIKLSGYPYLEYGMVRGIVKSISLVPIVDSYIIEIDLPNGLNTLYGTNLEFTQNMQGTAEIITEDLRLLQRIVNPFRYLITKNKQAGI